MISTSVANAVTAFYGAFGYGLHQNSVQIYVFFVKPTNFFLIFFVLAYNY